MAYRVIIALLNLLDRKIWHEHSPCQREGKCNCEPESWCMQWTVLLSARWWLNPSPTRRLPSHDARQQIHHQRDHQAAAAHQYQQSIWLSCHFARMLWVCAQVLTPVVTGFIFNYHPSTLDSTRQLAKSWPTPSSLRGPDEKQFSKSQTWCPHLHTV